MHFEKDFFSLDAEDIQRLITYNVSEDRHIEFKQQLPNSSDDEVKEFLADISAFANASGGMIIYGILEKDGIPHSIEGIGSDDFDREILRLENIVRSGVNPRINQLLFRCIDIREKKVILVLIPDSWSKPHVVNYKKRWRFYIRTSAGKHPMDIEEVRASMLQSSSLPERMRNFRDQRFDVVWGGVSPVPLAFDSPVVLHLIPFSSVYDSDLSQINFNVVTDNFHSIRPLKASVSHARYNLEGYLNYGNFDNEGKCSGYVQVFRNGIIESVDTSMLNPNRNLGKYVPSGLFGEELAEKIAIYLNFQKKIGVIPPIAVFLSLLNIQGFYLAVSQKLDPFEDHKYLLQRKSLLLPELIFEDYPTDVRVSLKPLFDTLWNAFGWDRSYYYSDEGAWTLSN